MSSSERPDHEFRVTEAVRRLGAGIGSAAHNLTFDLWVKSRSSDTLSGAVRALVGKPTSVVIMPPFYTGLTIIVHK